MSWLCQLGRLENDWKKQFLKTICDVGSCAI